MTDPLSLQYATSYTPATTRPGYVPVIGSVSHPSGIGFIIMDLNDENAVRAYKELQQHYIYGGTTAK
jgi:hypothetical protein